MSDLRRGVLSRTVLRLGGAGLVAVGLALGALALFSGGADGSGRLDHRMTVKDRVISGAYKAYGVEDAPVPMWLAKTVFHNPGESRITKLEVRYRVGRFADWSAFNRYPVVDPGQSVVDLYHPLFNEECARLTSRAPTELEMEARYVDAGGEERTISERSRITMLSRHEFIFSDLTANERTGAYQDTDTLSPLLAAWVSQSDAPIARLASMANKKAGGLGASSNDESAIKVLAHLYELMRTIHISYQHPQAMADSGSSYDIKLVQSLQYPRDTIQKRSGTCIDLAILYAALMNSVNIEPYLVTMDGHCFPLAKLPSGNLLPLEATGIGDGHDKSMDFEQAVESATKTWAKINQNGRFRVVNIREAWMEGASNPELDPLPADILEKWGITKLVEGKGKRKRTKRASDRGNDPRPTPPTPSPSLPAIAGHWSYAVSLPDGRVVPGQVQVSAQGSTVQMQFMASYQAPGPDGTIHNFEERSVFHGTMSGTQLSAVCQQAEVLMDGMPMPPQGLPWNLVLQLNPGGRQAQGQVGNGFGVTAPITMQR